jgi:hypothetical protein
MDMTVETESKSTWNPYGSRIKKTDIKKLYGLLHKANTPAERDEIMRNSIRVSPEYEKTVFENLIRNINDAFTTDRDCYKQFKGILYSFQDSMDDSGKPVQFKIKIKTGSRSRSRSRSRSSSGSNGKSKTPTKDRSKSRSPGGHLKCGLPARLAPSPQNSISNLSDLKLGIFVTAFLACARSQGDQFIKKYIHVTKSNGDPFPELADDISVDMNHFRDSSYEDEISDSKLRSNLIEHLKYTNSKLVLENESIFILYPFPQIYMNMTRKIRPSIRNLGGGRGKKGRNTRKFK